MRFGIMGMQIDALVPPNLPPERIMANIAGFDHAGLGHGFAPIELGGDLSLFLPHTFNPESIQNLTALKAQGISYTLHLPLWSVEPSTPLTPVRLGSVQALVVCEPHPVLGGIHCHQHISYQLPGGRDPNDPGRGPKLLWHTQDHPGRRVIWASPILPPASGPAGRACWGHPD